MKYTIYPVFCLACLSLASALGADPAAGMLPQGADGRPLNLDLESGKLDGWIANGAAFEKQPVRGDTVHGRRPDMQSGHQGEYWIGSYELVGDAPQGTLTSAAFTINQPWASFMVAGGNSSKTRVELVRVSDGQVLFKTSGDNGEGLKFAVVDLRPYAGQQAMVRLVDESSNGWGHINFDDFRLHADKPAFPAERVVAIADEYAHAGLEPEEAARAMSVPAGFSVKLFAGEPDVQQPIAMTIDDRGRLWVAEAHNYPHRSKDEDARDRILIFEDRDGDGHFDERKVFIEKLNLVSGIALGFGGVWVGAAPHFLFIPDRDHDDRPDGPPEVLLDGWGFHDTHETLNAFIWGPDGWLYGCHGVFTHSLVGKPGTDRADRTSLNAGIWRYHPTRHEFEVFAHGTSNPWGVDFDQHGEAFCTACVIPHLFHMIPGARYHRQAGSHFNAHTYDDIKTIADHVHWVGAHPHAGNNRSDAAGGGHAHSGAMIYQGGHWPEQYHGQIFMNNIHGARINVDVLEPAGSGFVGHHGADFLLANDSWSQILNLYYGPDGNVFMLDWYDQNQCHRVEPDIHDRSNGRIFKIVYGEQQAAPVDVAALGDEQLAELLLDKNEWFVRHARRLLQERAAAGTLRPGVRELLAQRAFEHPDPSRRLRNLWALATTGGLDNAQIERGLSNDQPYVRAWTIRIASEDGERLSAALPKMTQLAQADDSPVVRKFLASAAQRVPLAERWDLMAALVKHGDDAGDHNLPLCFWYALEPLVAADGARGLALVSDSPLQQLLAMCARRVANGAKEANLALVVDELGRQTEPARQLAILEGVQLGLKGRRRAPRPAAWSDVADKLRASADERVRNAVESLAVTLGDPAAFAELRRKAADPQQEPNARRAAIVALLSARDDQLAPVLQRLLTDDALRAEALRGLAAYGDEKTPAAILGVYAKLDPAERRDALATLASRTSYAAKLLDGLADKTIATSDVSADVIRQLRNLKDKSLDERIRSVWGEVRDTSADVAERIAQHRKLLTTKPQQEPDVALGRAMYLKTCQQCHTLFNVGGKVGPELTGSNRANLDYLLSNVLDPSSLISKDYMATVVATTDGRVLTGIIREQDDQKLTLATANETIVLPRDEVDELSPSTKSMMPDDVLQPLSEHQIRSLVAYLASPQQTPLLATAENAASLFNGVDLTGWSGNRDLWSVEGGELVGRTEGLDHNEFLVSDLAVGDFRLKFQVKLTGEAANSGVQFRSRPLEDGEVQGYQADIGKGWWGKLYEERGRGLLWDKSGEQHVKAGDWNDYEIEAAGSHIRTWINGQLCVDLDDAAGARRGVLALQLHAGPAMEARFRNFVLTVETTEPVAEGAQAAK
jgi:putative membrane-bound dehydrogenase-like protein